MANFKISGVLSDDHALNTPMGRKIWRHLPKGIFETADLGVTSKDIMAKDMLHLKAFKGDFLKPCPGTRNYICCGYQILNIATNCPLDCSYCILQSYFINQPGLRIHVNLEEKIESIMAEIDRNPQKIVRVGTGEFADSLALDQMAGWTGILMPHFSSRKNTVLEFKTKTNHIRGLLESPYRDRIIVSWSLNSPRVSEKEEKGAATLKQRLEAARTCQAEGFVTSFHFDPIIPHKNWKEGYRRTIDLMEKYLDPSKIIWISLGSFRFMPDLKALIRKRHPHSEILNGEFVMGLDGKARYFKPLRIALYRFMRENLEKWYPSLGLYLCMESDQVWRESMGWSPQISQGLSDYLDQRVIQIFG